MKEVDSLEKCAKSRKCRFSSFFCRHPFCVVDKVGFFAPVSRWAIGTDCKSPSGGGGCGSGLTALEIQSNIAMCFESDRDDREIRYDLGVFLKTCDESHGEDIIGCMTYDLCNELHTAYKIWKDKRKKDQPIVCLECGWIDGHHERCPIAPKTA